MLLLMDLRGGRPACLTREQFGLNGWTETFRPMTAR